MIHDAIGLLASYIYLKSVNYIVIEQNRGQLIFREAHSKIQLNIRDYKIHLIFVVPSIMFYSSEISPTIVASCWTYFTTIKYS